MLTFSYEKIGCHFPKKHTTASFFSPKQIIKKNLSSGTLGSVSEWNSSEHYLINTLSTNVLNE